MRPVTTPSAMPALALLTDHTPPGVALARVIVPPTATDEAPVIVPAAGAALTVTMCVAATLPQVPVDVNEIIAVPEAMPVTVPVVLTVALAGALLLHTPPLTELERRVVLPVHTVEAPLMVPASTGAATVTVVVAVAVPQVLDTV